MADAKLDTVHLKLAPGRDALELALRRVPVDVEFVRLVAESREEPSVRVREVTRLELGSDLKGELVLEDVLIGSTIELSLLGDDGGVGTRKRVAVEATSSTLAVELTRRDLEPLALPRPTPVANPQVALRAARLVQVGDARPGFEDAKLLVAPFARADWESLELSVLFATDTPVTISAGYPPQAGKWSALPWQRVHLAIDGSFEARFPLGGGDAWIWWLVGRAPAIGVVLDDLKERTAPVRAIALPPLAETSEGESSSKSACGGRRVPSDVSERELADNPGVYTEDPGAFCRPFANPERILGERSFFTVLRVEQPQISAEASIRTAQYHVLDFDPPQVVVDRSASETGLLDRVARTIRDLAGAATSDAVAIDPGDLRAAVARSTSLVRHALPARYLDWLTRLDRGRTQLDAAHPIQWEGDAIRYQATSVARGHILEYRVRWRSNGYSLGQVVKTLTLAPRQTKRVQKIEWQRLERSRREERTQLEDRVSDEVARERTYYDAVQASLSDWSRGDSSSSVTAAAGGIGFAAGSVVIGGGAAHSNASSQSSQEGGRRTSANEEQRLRDGIRRFGDALRRFESVVVTEVSQEESVTGTTEVIRNLNYGHSLTVIYYQILRHLRIETALAGVRECVFVPFAIKPFTIERAYRWRETIARNLLDPRHRLALQHLKDVLSGFASSSIPPGRRSDHPIRHVHGSLFIELAIERPRDANEGAFQEESWLPLQRWLPVPARSVWARLRELAEAQRDRTFQSEYAPAIAARWVNALALGARGRSLEADFTLASRYSFNGVVRVDFSIAGGSGLTREQLSELRVLATYGLPPGSVANLKRLSFTYHTDGFQRTVDVSQGADDLVNVVTGDADPDGALVSAIPDSWERQDLRVEIVRSVQDLVAHLNEHMEYYHKAIWWSMDRDRLFMMLDGFYMPGTDGLSIASVVEREPLAIAGNCLVYRVAAGSFLGYGKITTPEALYEYYADERQVSPPMHVSLPTDGLYAQTIMDECDALEEHYGSKDWVLEQPDPDLGVLDPSLLASRRAEPSNTQPTPFPSTIINLQNAPDAPAPTGLGAALDAVTRGDAFRDMTGLAGTQALTQAGMQTAAGLAAHFGSQAASLRLAELANKAHATQSADRQLASIERAKQKELLSPEEASRQAARVLEQMHDSPTPTRPHQEDAILAGLQTMSTMPGSVFESSSFEGMVRMAFGEKAETAGSNVVLASHKTQAPREHIVIVGGPSNFYNGFGRWVEDPPGSGDRKFKLNPPPTTLGDVADFCNENRGNETHDIYWANFIEPIPRLFTEGHAKPEAGDIVTLLVYYPPFAARSLKDWEASPYNVQKWRDSPWVANRDPYDATVLRSEQGSIPVKSRPTLPKPQIKETTNYASEPVSEERINHEILMRTTTETLRPGQTYGMRPTMADDWLQRLHDLPRRIVYGPSLGGKARMPGVMVKMILVNDPQQIVDYVTQGKTEARYWKHLLDTYDEMDMASTGGPSLYDTSKSWYDAAGEPPKGRSVDHWLKASIDRKKYKVSRLDYFGHSNDSAFFLKYGWDNEKGDPDGVGGEVLLKADDFDAALSSAPSKPFSNDAVAHLWGCSLATGFAPKLKKHVLKVIAAHDLTDYESCVLDPKAMPSPLDGTWTTVDRSTP